MKSEEYKDAPFLEEARGSPVGKTCECCMRDIVREKPSKKIINIYHAVHYFCGDFCKRRGIEEGIGVMKEIDLLDD